jgi:hypothetical protein
MEILQLLLPAGEHSTTGSSLNCTVTPIIFKIMDHAEKTASLLLRRHVYHAVAQQWLWCKQHRTQPLLLSRHICLSIVERHVYHAVA